MAKFRISPKLADELEHLEIATIDLEHSDPDRIAFAKEIEEQLTPQYGKRRMTLNLSDETMDYLLNKSLPNMMDIWFDNDKNALIKQGQRILELNQRVSAPKDLSSSLAEIGFDDNVIRSIDDTGGDYAYISLDDIETYRPLLDKAKEAGLDIHPTDKSLTIQLKKAGGGRVKRSLEELRKGTTLLDDAMKSASEGKGLEAAEMLQRLKELLDLDDDELGHMLGAQQKNLGPKEKFELWDYDPDVPVGGYAKGGKIVNMQEALERLRRKKEGLPDDVESREHLPPPEGVEEYYRNFMEKVNEGVRQKKEQIAQQEFLLKPGDIGYSAHSGKKFEILAQDINKDGALQYFVRGPDGEEHQMMEWGLTRKPLEPKEIMENKEEFQRMHYNKWADSEVYDEVLDKMYDWFDELDMEFDGDLQIVEDRSRPGNFGVMDMESGDQWTYRHGQLEEAEFDDWPPKGKYAEGGEVKKEKTAKDYLRALGRSLAGAVPGTSENFHQFGEDIGGQIYRKGALPVAGFKTQWWGINPSTGELEYAGPFSGSEEGQTDSIPGIIDETAALPLFAELVSGGALEAPEFAQEAGNRIMRTEEAVMEDMDLDDLPSGLVENILYSGGIMGGQVPVPTTWLNRAKGATDGGLSLLRRLAKSPEKVGRAGVEFLSPVIDPKASNYLAGALFGGGLMTGFEKLPEYLEEEGPPPSNIPEEWISLLERAEEGDEAAFRELQGLYEEELERLQRLEDYAENPYVQQSEENLLKGGPF